MNSWMENTDISLILGLHGALSMGSYVYYIHEYILHIFINKLMKPSCLVVQNYISVKFHIWTVFSWGLLLILYAFIFVSLIFVWFVVLLITGSHYSRSGGSVSWHQSLSSGAGRGKKFRFLAWYNDHCRGGIE